MTRQVDTMHRTGAPHDRREHEPPMPEDGGETLRQTAPANSGVMPARKRLMLIEPPFKRLHHDNISLVKYPLALGYLSGAVLKWTDWEVQTYNADFNPEKRLWMSYSYMMEEGFPRYLRTLADPAAPIWTEVRNAIADFKPDVVGITAKTQNFTSASVVARIAKECNPGAKVVLGGPHATLSTKGALECPDIDVAVLGEGEMTLVELLRTWGAGREDVGGVAGLAYRRNGHVAFTAPRPNLQDLDALPFPAESAPRVLRDYDRYPVEAFEFVFATRGCPYNCTFCESKAIWTRQARWRSPENVVREIKALQARGCNYVYFDDDTFGINPRYIKELCQRIEAECPDLRWGCEITVGCSKEQSAKYMRRAGCIMVRIGVESGNNRMLRKLKKGHTIEKAHAAVDLYRRKGIEAQTFFMIGLPEETEETLQDTMTAIRTINASAIMLNTFTPYPGSQLFEECRKLGVVDDDFDITLYNHLSPANCFTAHIAPERFRKLAAEAFAYVDRRNDRRRLLRALRMLRWRGIRHTRRECSRFIVSRLKMYGDRALAWFSRSPGHSARPEYESNR